MLKIKSACLTMSFVRVVKETGIFLICTGARTTTCRLSCTQGTRDCTETSYARGKLEKGASDEDEAEDEIRLSKCMMLLHNSLFFICRP